MLYFKAAKTTKEFPKMSKWRFLIDWVTSTCFGLVHVSKYNEDWDKKLNELIDAHWRDAKFGIGKYTVLLGEYEVWIRNKYAGYGTGVMGSYVDWIDSHIPKYGTYHNPKNDAGESIIYRPGMKTMYRLASLEEWLS